MSALSGMRVAGCNQMKMRNDTQRFKCRDCKYLFLFRRKDILKSNRFPRFRKLWIEEYVCITL